MRESGITNVALIGVGVIGRSWIRVFSRAGCRIHLFDNDPSQTRKALAWFEESLEFDVSDGFITAKEAESSRTLVSAHDDLTDALSGVQYIQESGPEKLEIKRTIFRLLDQTADPETIIASSTSSLDMNQIAEDLRGIFRCIMAHPFNPPHIIPVVEVMPTRKTNPEVTKATIDFLKQVGQKPVLVNFYVSGYLINRIQAAVVREAIHQVERGVADVDAVDTVIRDGLGLRWALFGNFGVNNTNADGGIREYYSRYGESYKTIMEDLDSTPPTFAPDMVERIGRGVDAMEGKTPLSAICRWRDRMVLRIRALKGKDPRP